MIRQSSALEASGGGGTAVWCIYRVVKVDKAIPQRIAMVRGPETYNGNLQVGRTNDGSYREESALPLRHERERQGRKAEEKCLLEARESRAAGVDGGFS